VALVAGAQAEVQVEQQAVALVAGAQAKKVEKEFRLHRPLIIAHGVIVRFWDRRHLGTAANPRYPQ